MVYIFVKKHNKNNFKKTNKNFENHKFIFDKKQYDVLRNKWLKDNSMMSLENRTLKGSKIELSPNEELLNMYFMNKVKECNKFSFNSYFPNVKFIYENNDIFKMLDRMPKGGLLNINSISITDLDWVLDKGIFINEINAIDDGFRCYINLDILNNKNPYEKGDKDLFKFSQSIPNGNWQVATKSFISENKQKIKERMTITDLLANSESHVVCDTFELINYRYEELNKYNKYAIESCVNGLLKIVQNGIQHIDISINFDKNSIEDRDKLIIDIIDKIKIFKFFIYLIIKKCYNNFTIKIILSIPILFSIKDILNILEIIYQIKTGLNYDNTSLSTLSNGLISIEDVIMLNDLVTGYNIINKENLSLPLTFYKDIFIQIPDIEKKYNNFLDGRKMEKVSLPFYFHDNELNLSMNKNIIDAVMLGAKRIGHGFNISFFPYIKKEIIRKDICLEIYPINNQINQYFRDLRFHYAKSMFREGIPMVLSIDNSVIFGYNGLTYDFWISTLSWDLDLKAIKRLVFNSIIYSSMSETEIMNSLRFLNASWNVWIDSECQKAGITQTTMVPKYETKSITKTELQVTYL